MAADAYFVWYLSTIILPVAFLMIFWPIVVYKTYVTKTGEPARPLAARGLGSC